MLLVWFFDLPPNFCSFTPGNSSKSDFFRNCCNGSVYGLVALAYYLTVSVSALKELNEGGVLYYMTGE